MMNKTVNRNGINYVLTYDSNNGKEVLSVNGVPAEQAWSVPSKKLCFAPFKIGTYNYWIVKYNNNIFLVKAGNAVTKEDFLNKIAAPAYNKFFSFCFIVFLIVAPTVMLSMLKVYMFEIQDVFFDMIMMLTGILFFVLLNKLPIASSKNRRLYCLGSLTAHIINLMTLIQHIL